MLALRREDWGTLNAVHGRRSRRLLVVDGKSGESQQSEEQSALTSILLADLSETCLRQVGEDPLGRFESAVAFITGRTCVLEADTDRRLIVLSEASIAAIEFAAANAALTNLVGRMRRALAASPDRAELAASLKGATTTLYAMFQARLLLHMAGEKAVPDIGRSLPERYRLFVHEQVALCLTFALLHEQAHIEIAGGTQINVEGLKEVTRFATTDDHDDQLEEHAADAWAVRQFGPAGRPRIAKAANFLFLNQWFYDYVSYSREGSHPPGFNRIQHLNALIGELKAEDPAFSEIMLTSLNEQHLLRKAFDTRERCERYAKALRYARKTERFRDYCAMVEAVCRVAEGLGVQGFV